MNHFKQVADSISIRPQRTEQDLQHTKSQNTAGAFEICFSTASIGILPGRTIDFQDVQWFLLAQQLQAAEQVSRSDSAKGEIKNEQFMFYKTGQIYLLLTQLPKWPNVPWVIACLSNGAALFCLPELKPRLHFVNSSFFCNFPETLLHYSASIHSQEKTMPNLI